MMKASSRNIDAKSYPAAVTSILTTLNNAGYEAVVVGGAPRDLLLGKSPHDWDLATNASPAAITEALLHDPNHPRNVTEVGASFGVTMIMDAGEEYAVATFRSDGTYSDGRHPDSVSFVGSLEEDLARRDFTINAIAADVFGNIYDPYGGMDDMQSGIIRAVGDPDQRMIEDPLRILRAIRLSNRYGFDIDDETFDAIKDHASELSTISHERIRDETMKLLDCDNVSTGIRTALDLGVADYMFPHLTEELAVEPGNIDNMMAGLDLISGDALAKMAYIGHEMEIDTRESGNYYHLSNEQVHEIKGIQEALAIFEGHQDSDILSRFAISSAGVENAVTAANIVQDIDPFRNSINSVQEVISSGDCCNLTTLAIGGTDILELGINGPAIGKTLNQLLDAVIIDPSLNNRESLLSIAAQPDSSSTSIDSLSTITPLHFLEKIDMPTVEIIPDDFNVFSELPLDTSFPELSVESTQPTCDPFIFGDKNTIEQPSVEVGYEQKMSMVDIPATQDAYQYQLPEISLQDIFLPDDLTGSNSS